MIRAFAALAAACALAACGASSTPSRADVERAVSHYYDLGSPTLPLELRNASITGFGECQPFRDAFQCPMEVENASGERVPLVAYIERNGREWRVDNLSVILE
jgi:hypothetical protein